MAEWRTERWVRLGHLCPYDTYVSLTIDGQPGGAAPITACPTCGKLPRYWRAIRAVGAYSGMIAARFSCGSHEWSSLVESATAPYHA